MADTLEIFNFEYSNINGIQVQDSNQNWLTFIRPIGTLNITDNGTVDCAAYASVVVAIPTATGASF